MRLKLVSLILPLILLLGLAFFSLPAFAQSSLPVRVDRWLEVQALTGTVTFQRDNNSQAAQIGTRLESVGDTLSTGKSSSATLAVDTGIGTVNVAESTSIQMAELELLSSGGRVTILKVSGGQARLQLRPFTDPDSRFEIETPAGVSGVRGTVFGISVQPDGTTGVATLEGRVMASAQGQSVSVDAGLQSLIVPGEPPTPPTALQDNVSLSLLALNRVSRQVTEIVGQIDAVNLLVINDAVQNVDRTGRFTIQSEFSSERRIRATVITPLGKKQDYDIVIP